MGWGMPEAIHVVCGHCNSVVRLPSARAKELATLSKVPLRTLRRQARGPERRATSINTSGAATCRWSWISGHPWCGPCLAMAPFFEAAARELEPNLRFAKLNTQDEPAPATRFNIRSIPTLIVFRGGKEIARQSGAMDSRQLAGWLSSVTG